MLQKLILVSALVLSLSAEAASANVQCFVGRNNGDSVCHRFENGQLKSSSRINRKGQRSRISRPVPVLFKPNGAPRNAQGSGRR